MLCRATVAGELCRWAARWGMVLKIKRRSQSDLGICVSPNERIDVVAAGSGRLAGCGSVCFAAQRFCLRCFLCVVMLGIFPIVWYAVRQRKARPCGGSSYTFSPTMRCTRRQQPAFPVRGIMLCRLLSRVSFGVGPLGHCILYH